MDQITGTDGAGHDPAEHLADQSIKEKADLRGRILKNGGAVGLMAAVVGMVGLSLAQTINPTQPGANANPVPGALTRDMFQPLMPASPGQDRVARRQPTLSHPCSRRQNSFRIRKLEWGLMLTPPFRARKSMDWLSPRRKDVFGAYVPRAGRRWSMTTISSSATRIAWLM